MWVLIYFTETKDIKGERLEFGLGLVLFKRLGLKL